MSAHAWKRRRTKASKRLPDGRRVLLAQPALMPHAWHVEQAIRKREKRAVQAWYGAPVATTIQSSVRLA